MDPLRTSNRPVNQRSNRNAQRRTLLLVVALGLAVAGLFELTTEFGEERRIPVTTPEAAPVQDVAPGVVARMDSPSIVYSPGWNVSPAGADPAEPATPELTPAGVFTLTYRGGELALNLALGDYWGYLYATVDGAPANLLPTSNGHVPPPALRSGYRPFFAPELVLPAAQGGNSAPVARWVRIHKVEGADGKEMHTVRVEVWRSWGQTPIRAIAVDALPPLPYKQWPGVLLLLLGAWLATPWWIEGANRLRWVATFVRPRGLGAYLRMLLEGTRMTRAMLAAALAGVALLALSIWLDNWIVCLGGLGLLGVVGLVRPSLWYGALFFGLPFYYAFALPLLPGRALNLVDTGVYLGLGVALAHWLLHRWSGLRNRYRLAPGPMILLALIASWALVSLFAAEHFGVALREWRTIFLMAVALAVGLALTLQTSRALVQDISIIFGGWLLGAAIMASAALLLYPDARVIIPAEGVNRLRAFYGSPNNLALYLDRTLAVTLALALFRTEWRVRLICLVLALPQAAAYLLTFSRAGLFVALPVMLVALWIGGWVLLGRAQRSRRVLWLIAIIGVLVGVGLLPFVGSERISGLLNTAQGTGFLRLNLWRSGWEMGLDHKLLGVGPDNFLYAYRSRYILPQAWMEPNLNHPHTWLLDWWTRLGLPGMALGLFFWLLVLNGAVARMRTRVSGAQWPAFYLGIIAAVAAALAHGLLDISYALPDLMAVWALFAIMASLESPQSLPPA
jgi:O-antigen ligase